MRRRRTIGQVALKKPATLVALGVTAAAVDPSYKAILDYADTQGFTKPSPGIQQRQNTLMKALQSSGIWGQMDLFYNFYTDGDANFAKINWKNPGTFQAVGTGHEPTFTSLLGFVGNGTSQYLDTQWTPSLHAVNFSLTSSWISYGEAAAIPFSTTNFAGINGSSSQLLFVMNGAANTIDVRFSISPAAVPIVNTQFNAGAGVYQLWRESAALVGAKKDSNVDAFGASSAGTALPAFSYPLLAGNSVGSITGFSAESLNHFAIGATLTPLQRAAFVTAWYNYTAPPFSAEYQAVINKAMALGYTLPSIAQQRMQDELMKAWVTAGVFAKADVLYCLANDAGLNFAKINWKDPNQNLLTEVGVVNYVLNQGPWTDSASPTAGGLDTGLLASAAVNFTLNSNSVVHSTLSGYAATGVWYRAGLADLTTGYSIDFVRAIHNNAGGGISGGAAHNNFSWMNRRTATNVYQLLYTDAGAVNVNLSGATVAVAKEARPMYLLNEVISASGLYNTGSPFSAFFMGGALTDPEFLAYDVALKSYLNKLRYVELVYTPLGAGNYTVPAGITQLLVECWGGGGAGRGFSTTATKTGAGGAGGGYTASLINVTPGAVIGVYIGPGGTGSTGAGQAGQDTYWDGGVVVARGGAGGGTVDFDHANGGSAAAGVGDIKFSGGGGGAQGTVLNASTGSGGSGASSLGNGLGGYDAVAGSGAYTRVNYNSLGPGTPGPSQGNATNGPGINGMMSSGGGGARRTTTTKVGGNGGQGFIRLSAPRVY